MAVRRGKPPAPPKGPTPKLAPMAQFGSNNKPKTKFPK